MKEAVIVVVIVILGLILWGYLSERIAELERGEFINMVILKEAGGVTDECICEGNWRLIVKKSGHLIGKTFVDENGDRCRFFGIVHGADDYYYGMIGSSGLKLLSCVGDIEGHGFHQEVGA